MTESVKQLPTTAPRVSLIEKLAAKYHVEPGRMLGTLKATAFRQNDGEVSNEQMMALLVVADQYGLNPWTREIYAFPDRNRGIVPVVGVDGFSRILNEHPQFDGIEFAFEEAPISELGGGSQLVSCTCTIYRKDRTHPTRITEYFSECRRDTQPWKSHPRRMLRHKALIQCARVAMGFAGIYDEDEAERIAAAGGGRSVVDLEPAPQAQPQTRTDGLAATLAQRAKSAETIDPETGEIKSPPPAKLFLDIENARKQAELQPLLDKIMSLPASTERVDLLTKWNERSLQISPPQPPQTNAAPQAPKEADLDRSAPRDGQPASAAPATQATDQPGSGEVRKEADSRTPEPAPSTPFDGPAQPSLDRKGAELVGRQMREAKTREEVDAIAERENERKWPMPLRKLIYQSYQGALERFGG